MKRAQRNLRASGAVSGAALGGALAIVIDIGARVIGHPLPDGAATPLGLALGTICAYFAPGGRRGEAD